MFVGSSFLDVTGVCFVACAEGACLKVRHRFKSLRFSVAFVFFCGVGRYFRGHGVQLPHVGWWMRLVHM